MRLPRPLVRAVARAKPLVPERAWPALLAARSFRGDGPIVGTPAFGTVLCLAPHPDDEAVGPGGTLALLTAAGARVTVVFATDGEATRGSALGREELAAARRAEAVRSCQILGVAATRFLGLPDGDVAAHVDDVVAVIRDVPADAVFVPWFGDGHDDHRAPSDAVVAASLGAGVEVWGYETWTPLPANRIVDITAVVERKRAAIGAHRTAHLAFDVGALIGLNRYRSVHGLMGRGYAEAFLAAAPDAYARLVAAARR